jgi:octaprenyl-diphosphate synthase
VTTFQSIQQTLAPELTQLNDLISATLTSPNALMNKVVATYLEKKGKQIRPVMVILSAKLLGEINENVIKGAVAVELLHNASLIHDDVVDDTRVRRDAQTINGLWDNHLAVLIGDFFLSNALVLASETKDIRMVDSIASLGRLLSIGELDEIYNARYNDLNEDVYYKIIYRKTASLFISCAEVGAYAVGETDEQKLEALREFARLLGLCFQIKDDIFDYFSDSEIGKPTGNDLREGKITLPLLHVLETGEGPEHERMVELARKEALDSDEIATLIDYAVRNGGIEYAQQSMERMRDEAVKLLRENFEPSETVEAFISLLEFIISRNR